MPFTRIEVVDFQSIAAADIELGVREGGGGITTIVGPSSTGKSAFLRAVRMLVRNASAAPVRIGAKKAVVRAEFDGRSVEVSRGKALSTYVLDTETFAKAGVSVPEAVAKALGLREDTPDPHFAFQFDAPYLLSVPGSVVSSTLGRLTHANVLREAVREGARRAQAAKHTKDIRTKDALELAAAIKERFATLPAREQAFKDAQEVVAKALDADTRADTLGHLLEALEAASTGLEAVSAARARYDDVFPLVEQASTAMARAKEVEEVVSLLDRATTMRAAQQEMAAACAQEADAAEGEYNKLLVEAGICPTCGGKTS